MSIDCSPGFSFHLGGHLCVVVAELPGPPVQVVFVSLTSKKIDSDTTVILQSGDHSFIKKDTVISYSDTRQITKDVLIDRIKQKYFGTNDVFDEDKLKIIQDGLLKSPYTPNGIKNQCKKVF